jgi:hypothetical protein
MLVQQLQTGQSLALARDPLSPVYDLKGNTLINEAVAVNPSDVPNLQQVQLVTAGAAGGVLPGSIALTADLASTATGKGSKLVAWIRRVTGGVSRWVEDKLDENISVKDFGAKGDGVTDDTAAIQAAANYCASVATGGALGAKLYFPAGLYKTSAAINITAGFIVYGDGVGSTKFRTNNNYVFSCTASGAMFRDLFVAGPYGAASNGINLNGANNCIIERCTFQNQVTGVQLTNSFSVEIIGCTFDTCYTYGVYAGTICHSLIIERSGFFSCGVLNSGQAINLTVASNNIGIKDNDFEYNYVGIQLMGCTSVEITGNYMEYPSSTHFSFPALCYSVVIENNWIALGTSGGASLTISRINGGSFKYNSVYNQSVAFDSTTLVGFTVGVNYKAGTGTLGGPPYIAPTLANSWGQQGGYTVVGYIKDDNGYVRLKGCLYGGTVPAVMFTLPVGYRPSETSTFATASPSGPGIVTVNTDGTIVPSGAASNNPSVNGIAFYAGP